MDRDIFNFFFYFGETKVGPTIYSLHTDGDWVGTVKLIPTKKNILLNNSHYIVGIREFNNSITDDLYNCLKYLAIKKSEFDRFINSYYMIEWESADSPKPDIWRLQHRMY